MITVAKLDAVNHELAMLNFHFEAAKDWEKVVRQDTLQHDAAAQIAKSAHHHHLKRMTQIFIKLNKIGAKIKFHR